MPWFLVISGAYTAEHDQFHSLALMTLPQSLLLLSHLALDLAAGSTCSSPPIFIIALTDRRLVHHKVTWVSMLIVHVCTRRPVSRHGSRKETDTCCKRPVQLKTTGSHNESLKTTESIKLKHMSKEAQGVPLRCLELLAIASAMKSSWRHLCQGREG